MITMPLQVDQRVYPSALIEAIEDLLLLLTDDSIELSDGCVLQGAWSG